MGPLAHYGNFVSERLSSKVLILVDYLLAKLETLLFLLLLLKLDHHFFQLFLGPLVNIQVISMPLLLQEELFKVLVAKTLVDNLLNQESLFRHAGYPKLVFISFLRDLDVVLISDIVCLVIDTAGILIHNLASRSIVHDDSISVIVVSIVDWIKVLIYLPCQPRIIQI